MLSSFSKISECEKRLLILWDYIKSEVQFHLYESIVLFIALAFVDIELVCLDSIIEMTVDLKRRNTNGTKGRITLF